MTISLAGLGTTPCCTPAQASDPTYTNFADGSYRYSTTSSQICNPNCVGLPGDAQQNSDIAMLQNQINALNAGTPWIAGISNQTVLIAGAVAFIGMMLLARR